MSISSAPNISSTAPAMTPPAAPTEPIMGLSDPPLPTDQVVIWALEFWKTNRPAIVLMNEALFWSQTPDQKRNFWLRYADQFRIQVASAKRKIDKEKMLTDNGKEIIKKAVEEIGGMLEKYRKLPSGVTWPKRRADKLADLLVIAVDNEEKKQAESQ